MVGGYVKQWLMVKSYVDKKRLRNVCQVDYFLDFDNDW